MPRNSGTATASVCLPARGHSPRHLNWAPDVRLYMCYQRGSERKRVKAPVPRAPYIWVLSRPSRLAPGRFQLPAAVSARAPLFNLPIEPLQVPVGHVCHCSSPFMLPATRQQLLGLKPLVTADISTPAGVLLQRVKEKSVGAADLRLACRRLDPGNCTFISLLCWGARKELGALLFWTEDEISTRGVEI